MRPILIAKNKFPAIYLAGKIGKNDWRHDLVQGLRDKTWLNSPLESATFNYVGPFFVSCDHGCAHSPDGHGLVTECIEPYYSHEEVIRLNMAALAKAELVFAFINAPDCYGTIVEIGYAIAKGKRVAMAFAPEIEVDDFWFSYKQCSSVYHNIRECCLPEILAVEVQKTAAQKWDTPHEN